jgi:hypothetical protein
MWRGLFRRIGERPIRASEVVLFSLDERLRLLAVSLYTSLVGFHVSVSSPAGPFSVSPRSVCRAGCLLAMPEGSRHAAMLTWLGWSGAKADRRRLWRLRLACSLQGGRDH